VLGANAVIQQAKPGRASPWLLGVLARKPKKVAAVALANKACPGAGRGWRGPSGQ
jgi:transposase